MKSTSAWVYTGAVLSVAFLVLVLVLLAKSERVGPPPPTSLPEEAFVDPQGIPETLEEGRDEGVEEEEGDEGEEGEGDPFPDIPREHEREVILFFQSAERNRLSPEIRTILRTASVADQARQVIVELINGSREGHLKVVPSGTRLRELYLTGTGILCVDFSQDLVKGHSGGSAAEIATIYAIVNSLTVNFPEFDRVQFLIEGEERETLKYHVDLIRTYEQDLSLVEERFL